MYVQTQEHRENLSKSRIKLLRENNGIPDGWLTTGDAAAYLHISQSRIWYAYNKGQLEGKLFGRLVCFTMEMLDTYKAQRHPLETETDTSEEVVRQAPVLEPAWFAPPMAEDEYAPPRLLVRAPEQALPASASAAKRLDLSGGGSISLSYDIDLFAATEQERTLLFTLIDAMKQFER